MSDAAEPDGWDESLNAPLRVCQIIVASLAAGTILFLLFVRFAPAGNQPAAPRAADPPLIFYVGLAATAGAFLVRFVVVRAIEAVGRQKLAQQQLDLPTLNRQLLALYQQRLIVASALIEGPTFLLLIAYMTEHGIGPLAVASVLIALMLSHIPTRSRVARWLDQQRRWIADSKSFQR